MYLSFLVSAFLAFSLSLGLSLLVRKYAIRLQIIDLPNDRSNHTLPTPRGGGIGIVCVIILFLLMVTPYVLDGFTGFWITSIILVAGIGWLDDQVSLSSWLRLIFQTVGALIFLLSPNFLSVFQSTGIFAFICITLLMVWLTNLYNFMDGIDGLAASQGMVAAIAASVFFYLSGQVVYSYLCCGLAAAIAGFLVVNWHPAKIFMGDVGSYGLGFMFACLALLGQLTNSVPILVWLVLLAVFISDATFTLVHRVLKGETWYRAHCDHAYQRLVRSGFSHKKVTMAVLIINIILLWPLAYLSWSNPEFAPWIVVSLYLVAWFCWYRIIQKN